MFVRISAAAVITAISVALVSLMTGRPISAAIELPEVQRQVAATKNLAFTTSFLVEGKFETSGRTVVRHDGVARYDSDKGYSITNLRERKAVAVRTDRKSMTVFEGLAFEGPETYNVYRMIHDIAKNPVEDLGERQIEGRLCKGIKVQLQVSVSDNRMADVWVDPRTMLPVLIEMKYRQNGNDEVERLHRFEYDLPIPDGFFEMNPPEGFEVHATGIRTLAPAAADRAISAPTVTPLVGIGPAKFRMTEKEVIEVLGKPEREREDTVQGRRILSYYSLGFELEFLPPENARSGLQNIACLGNFRLPIKIREFQGQTDKGIGLGASQADIERLYGKPSYVTTSTRKDTNGKEPTDPEERKVQTNVNYFDLGLRFMLTNDKVYRIDLYVPMSKPAKK